MPQEADLGQTLRTLGALAEWNLGSVCRKTTRKVQRRQLKIADYIYRERQREIVMKMYTTLRGKR